MKTRFLLGQMIDYLPGQLKDAIHLASKEAGQETDKLELHRQAHSEKAQVNQLDPKCRKSLKYVSYRSQDRDDEIVVPGGIELKEFMKYGHCLVNHNYSLLPVGSDDWIIADDYGIKALTTHADTGEGTLANVIWHLVSQGHMKSSSIGFVPVETTKPGRRDWDAVANKLQREWPEFSKAAAEKSVSRIITKGVLLEHSFVSVPCNVDAEVEQIIKGMGIKDETVFKGLGWKTEEKDGVLVPKREVIVVETPDGKKVEKGGPGSGNYGHSGRPGKIGGSGDNSLSQAQEDTVARLRAKHGDGDYEVKPDDIGMGHHVFIKDPNWPNAKPIHYFVRNDGSSWLSHQKSEVYPTDEKSLDLTCSRKLASLRKRLPEEGQDQLDGLEKELEGLAEDDAEGWKALNGKLNALLAGLKKGADAARTARQAKGEEEGEERFIKIVQHAPSIKVLFTPMDPEELSRVTRAAVEKAVSRKLGRLG